MTYLNKMEWVLLPLILALSQASAFAMGKTPVPVPTGGCTPPTGYTTPNPVRRVVLKPVGTKNFQMPNGATIDMSADLGLMLNTSVTNSNVFSPTDGGANGTGDDICGNHIEIRAGVSTFVLNAFELGISFGYTPSGNSSVLTGVTGKANVRVGNVAMDFSVWECTAGICSAVSAVTASASTAGVEIQVELDFGTIKTGPDLIYNTPIGNALRKIMDDGMKKMATSARLSELSWSARVRESIPAAGTLIFDAGLNAHLQPNQSFAVYAVTPATGVCSVFKSIAYIHTTQIDPISSSALVDQVLDARAIQDGDVIMIRPTSSASN